MFPIHDNNYCTGISAADNLTFVALMHMTFAVAERNAWGSTFLKAEKAHWIEAR